MLIKRPTDLKYSDITPREVYLNRRKFLAGAAVAGGAMLAGRGVWDLISPGLRASAATTQLTGLAKSPFSTTEKQNTFNQVTTYNNFYEFGSDNGEPSQNAGNFKTSPWSVSVEGEVAKPRTFTMDELMKLAPLEERIYRHRCVETWSIVVPWIGYSFSALAKAVQPTSNAKYVAFQSFYDPQQMPWGKRTGILLPYVEGLRLDEAMHPLALLCVGMYGQTLPNQDGAPVRMVLPWKYGFKSIKSLVKIRFVKNEPPTTWKTYSSEMYGFYSNVNPKVDNPNWSQAKERRLGEVFMRPTLMFNGYPEVGGLYANMDLSKSY